MGGEFNPKQAFEEWATLIGVFNPFYALSRSFASFRNRDVVLIVPHRMYCTPSQMYAHLTTLYPAKNDNSAVSMLTLYSKLIKL